MDIPLFTISTAFHVGSMKQAKKGSHSYEGHGLSVSNCPDSWVEIAGLGGRPLWALHRDGAKWIDFHSLGDDAQAEIRRWAIGQGLIEVEQRWRVWEWDSEECVWRRSLFKTEESAVAEAEYMYDCEEESDFDLADAFDDLSEEARSEMPDGLEHPIEHIEVSVLTAAGMQRAPGYGDDTDGIDMAVMFWAEDVLREREPNVVGVWWMDDHDVMSLSAPRGAIIPASAREFSVKKISWGAYNNMTEEFLKSTVFTLDAPPAPTPFG